MGTGKSGLGRGFASKVANLQTPNNPTMFADSKVSPLAYDKSKLIEVVFGDWRKDENFIGIQDVDVSKIVTVQPYVQSNKLLSFKQPIDTTSVEVLKIGNKFYLGDGNHRVVAAMLSGKKKIRIKVYEE